MKKVQFYMVLALFLGIVQDTHGMNSFMNGFSQWFFGLPETTTSSNSSNTDHKRKNENETTPENETTGNSDTKKTKQDTYGCGKKIDLTDLTGTAETITSRFKFSDEVIIDTENLFKQNDGYSCGLYAFFHYLWRSGKAATLGFATYENFIEDLSQHHPAIKTKNANREYLSHDDISSLINLYSENISKDCIVLPLLEKNGLPSEISDFDIINNIQTEYTIFWVIVHMDDPYKHWLCLEVKKNTDNDHKKYTYFDSLNPTGETLDKTIMTIFNATKLFSGDLKLPSTQDYRTARQKLRSALITEVETERTKQVEAVKNNTKNQITEKVFNLLLELEKQRLASKNAAKAKRALADHNTTVVE